MDEVKKRRRVARDRETLSVPLRFADNARGRVARWIPARFADSRQHGEDDLTDAEVAAQAANEAWHAYRKRLGTPKARRQSLPPPPSWQSSLQPLKRRKTVEVGGIAGDGASEFMVTDAMRQKAFDARQNYLDRLSAGMHRRDLPVTEADAKDVVAHMNDAGFNPAGYAYAKMCDRISNAWRRKA